MREGRGPCGPGPHLLPAALAALVAGGATSVLQTVLPHPLAPLANSAGPWCLLAWLLARAAPTPARGTVVATLGLLGLVAGYYLTAGLRGFAVGPTWATVWVVVALVAGPVLGLGAVGSRLARGWARVVAALVLPVLLVAESAYGLVLLRGSTPTAYWVGEGVVALALAVTLVTGRAARVSRGPGRGAGHERAAVR